MCSLTGTIFIPFYLQPLEMKCIIMECVSKNGLPYSPISISPHSFFFDKCEFTARGLFLFPISMLQLLKVFLFVCIPVMVCPLWLRHSNFNSSEVSKIHLSDCCCSPGWRIDTFRSLPEPLLPDIECLGEVEWLCSVQENKCKFSTEQGLPPINRFLNHHKKPR